MAAKNKTKPKHPGGRPCKNPSGEPADSVVYVYVTRAQYEDFCQRAVEAKVSLSTWGALAMMATPARAGLAYGRRSR